MPRFSLSEALLGAAAVALLVLLPATAPAHEIEPERQALVQVFEDHVDIMVVYAEAPGERSNLFFAQYGLALQADDSELVEQLAGPAMLPRMLDGLEFELKGESPRVGDPEIKFRTEDDHLQAAVFVRYELDSLSEDDRRTLVIRAHDRSFLPTELLVYGGGTVDSVHADVPRAEGLDAHQFNLTRGGEHRVIFQRR